MKKYSIRLSFEVLLLQACTIWWIVHRFHDHPNAAEAFFVVVSTNGIGFVPDRSMTTTKTSILPSSSNSFSQSPTVLSGAPRRLHRRSYRNPPQSTYGTSNTRHNSSPLDDMDILEDDDENAEPGRMKISEIKAELDLRGVSYVDCFDRESLSERLMVARATGRANPDILDRFNKAKLEETFNEQKLEIKDDDLRSVAANDGTLPGGMNVDTFQKMMNNPDLMLLLQNTKMQDAMKLMMTGGSEQLEAAIEADPELREIVQKLDKVMKAM